MSNEAGAGAGNGQDGSGAPSGGSPEGGSENDDKPITAKQLKAALASQRAAYEGKLAESEARFQAFKEGLGKGGGGNADNAPKRYSRADLKAAVDAGQITQEQGDELWAKQIESDATEKAVAAATAVVKGGTQKERVDREIESYKRLKPEIMEEGSELREKVRQEFQYLVDLGDPGRGEGAVQTQLKAIRAVLGPLDKLEKSASARRAPESEQQGGGSGGRPASQGGNGSGKKLNEYLNADNRAHYERGIKSGRYKDWDAVDKELKYASPTVKNRLGLPA